MALLGAARLLIVCVPLRYWRGSLGLHTDDAREANGDGLARARSQAAQVERAAWRLPAASKCLPQAVALSWILRRKLIAHDLVIAARPQGRRESPDALHAWIEVSGETVLGALPGPWIETYRANASVRRSRM